MAFSSEFFNFKDSNLVFWIVLSILHPLTEKSPKVSFLFSKYSTSLNVPKKTSLFNSQKNKVKIFLRSRNLFCSKVQVSLVVLSLYSCSNDAVLCKKSEVFEVLYFRRRTCNGGVQFGFKDGGRVIVPVFIRVHWLDH